MKARKIGLAMIAALLLLLWPAAARAQDENLLQNPGFDLLANGFAQSWAYDMYNLDEGYTQITFDPGRSGNAACIINIIANDARLEQRVDGQPNTVYRISGYIKADQVEDGWGANLSVLDTFACTEAVFSTGGQWQYVEMYGRTEAGQSTFTVCARLGGYSGESTGAAWFDDLAVVAVDGAPEGIAVQSLATISKGGSTVDSTDASTRNDVLVVAMCLLFGLFILWIRNKQIRDFSVNLGPDPSTRAYLPVLLLIGLAVRILLAASINGYPNDIACWKGWADQTASGGLFNLYVDSGFCDYPPGYMYVLWVLGQIRLLLGISYDSAVYTVLVKLPAIACDLAASWLVYRLARDRLGQWPAVLIACAYLFNPAVIVDSSAWGQIDSILALCAVGYLWQLRQRRIVAASLLFVLGILLKPQMLMFGPVLLVVFIHYIREQGWAKAMKAFGVSVLLAGGAFVLLVAPFTQGQHWTWIFDKYFGTMVSYPYVSLSALNVYGMLGVLWKSYNVTLLGISYKIWGILGIAATLGFYLFIALKDRDRTHTFYHAALLLTGLFALGGMMHERYMFPVLLILLVYAVVERNRFSFGLFGLFSMTQGANITLTLIKKYLTDGSPLIFIISTTMVAGYFVMAYEALRMVFPQRMAAWEKRTWRGWLEAWRSRRAERAAAAVAQGKDTGPDAAVKARLLGGEDGRAGRMAGKDWLILSLLTVFYAALAFTYLGDTQVPQRMWQADRLDQSVVIELTGSQDIEEFWLYKGLCAHQSAFRVEIPDGTGGWTEVLKVDYTQEPYKGEYNDLYKWFIYDMPCRTGSVRITVVRPTLRLLEVAFKDASGAVLPVAGLGEVSGVAQDAALALIDEQGLVPAAPTHMNGTYFDEIYHARTGWETLNNIDYYETTHPPLGKDLIALSIRIFGMTPFGWRFMGTLVGVLMIPLMYVFGKRLFKKSLYAFLAAFLMAFDCMHFTQTRIATIDSYGVLFIIAMYLCMYVYYRMSFNREPLIKTLVPLALSGVFFGLGAASKWIGLYAGAGLAVIFFYTLWQRWQEVALVGGGDVAEVSPERAADITAGFKRRVILTLLTCLVFFVIVPAGIYVASYIPYMQIPSAGHDLAGVWKNQLNMFNYHSHLVDSHPFKSPWYEWPLIIKPMWYYMNNYLREGWIGSIVALGNPAVWWPGIVALLAVLWQAAVGRGRAPRRLFLALAFLAQYLPWMLVPRSMFIYHYFATLPFMMLAMVYFIQRWVEADARRKVWLYVFMGVVVALFALFYPIMTGLPIPVWLARFMRWMPTWYFIY